MKPAALKFHRANRSGKITRLIAMDAMGGIEQDKLDKLLTFLEGKLSDEDYGNVINILDPDGASTVGSPAAAMDARHGAAQTYNERFPNANRLK